MDGAVFFFMIMTTSYTGLTFEKINVWLIDYKEKWAKRAKTQKTITTS
jgi:hypothetical protein